MPYSLRESAMFLSNLAQSAVTKIKMLLMVDTLYVINLSSTSVYQERVESCKVKLAYANQEVAFKYTLFARP